MEDRDPDRTRDTERTTIIHTDGGSGGGGGGLLVAVVALILLAALLFFLFGGNFGRESDEGDVNVNIDSPEVPAIEMPNVNVNVPEAGGDDGDTATNRSE